MHTTDNYEISLYKAKRRYAIAFILCVSNTRVGKLAEMVQGLLAVDLKKPKNDNLKLFAAVLTLFSRTWDC